MTPLELIEKAKEAAANAHAPYSHYRVGAALLCDDGSVFMGCNVENASFGLTNCAERTAVFSAIAAGKNRFKALAVASLEEQTPFPCGACRQVLAEFLDQDFPVYIAEKDAFKTICMGDLLPYTFKLKNSDV
jgi:cytidine deaminase